jgi:hypothetical protein
MRSPDARNAQPGRGCASEPALCGRLRVGSAISAQRMQQAGSDTPRADHPSIRVTNTDCSGHAAVITPRPLGRHKLGSEHGSARPEQHQRSRWRSLGQALRSSRSQWSPQGLVQLVRRRTRPRSSSRRQVRSPSREELRLPAPPRQSAAPRRLSATQRLMPLLDEFVPSRPPYAMRFLAQR